MAKHAELDKAKDALNLMRENGTERKDDYREYYKRKRHAYYLELQKPVNKIVVFPSVDAPWYKMGWNSALIYAFDVGIRANKAKDAPKIHSDNDQGELRSRDGVVMIRSIKKMVQRLRDIGIVEYKETEDGLYIFELKKEYSKDELKKFRNFSFEKLEQLTNMAAPKTKALPRLRICIVRLISTVMPKISNLPSAYQNTLGASMANVILDMNQKYFALVNARLPAQECYNAIVVDANSLMGDLMVVGELKLWNPIETVEVGSQIIDLKMCVKNTILKKKVTDGTGQK